MPNYFVTIMNLPTLPSDIIIIIVGHLNIDLYKPYSTNQHQQTTKTFTPVYECYNFRFRHFIEIPLDNKICPDAKRKFDNELNHVVKNFHILNMYKYFGAKLGANIWNMMILRFVCQRFRIIVTDIMINEIIRRVLYLVESGNSLVQNYNGVGVEKHSLLGKLANIKKTVSNVVDRLKVQKAIRQRLQAMSFGVTSQSSPAHDSSTSSSFSYLLVMCNPHSELLCLTLLVSQAYELKNDVKFDRLPKFKIDGIEQRRGGGLGNTFFGERQYNFYGAGDGEQEEDEFKSSLKSGLFDLL